MLYFMPQGNIEVKIYQSYIPSEQKKSSGGDLKNAKAEQEQAQRELDAVIDEEFDRQ